MTLLLTLACAFIPGFLADGDPSTGGGGGGQGGTTTATDTGLTTTPTTTTSTTTSSSSTTTTTAPTGLTVGLQAPTLTGQDHEGNDWSLYGLRGTPAFLTFGAGYDLGFQLLSEALGQVAGEYAVEPVAYLTRGPFNEQVAASTATYWADLYDLPLVVFDDSGIGLDAATWAPVQPRTFVLDADLTIVAIIDGPLGEAEVREALEQVAP